MNAAASVGRRVVVKLGGSLANTSALAQWLRELATNDAAQFAVVPGGGAFADAARNAQRRWRFGDAAAHAMAIAAMEQFGHMLCGIERSAAACTTLEQIEHAWTQQRLPVWLPYETMRRNASLPANWDSTSDTFAAWLAHELRANGLVLVKSCDVPPASREPAALSAAGIVDRALPGFLASHPIALRTMHRDRCHELTAVVRSFR